MPKTPINYKNTQMYKLCCKELDVKHIYVGHTTNWEQRKKLHKSDCKSKNLKVYQCIRDNGGWDNWHMVWIEDYPCDNKRQSEKRERELCEELHADLNSIRPYRTREEQLAQKKAYQEAHYEANKEHVLAQKKARYEENKDKILAQKKAYREANKDKILAQQKAHYEANKDKILARNKAHYEANKDKILAQQKAYREAKKQTQE